MVLKLVLIGFVSIVFQVLLLRELNTALYGVELIYIISIGVWLASTSIGAVVNFTLFRFHPENRISLHFLLLFLLTPVVFAFIHGSHLVFHGTPGAFLPFYHQLLLIVTSLLPIGFLSGRLLRLIAAQYMERGNSLAMAYGIECLGSLAGGVLTTFQTMFHTGNFCAAMLVCFTASMILLLGNLKNRHDRNPGRITFHIVFAAFFLLLLFISPQIEHSLLRLKHDDLYESVETPYGRVTLTSSGNQQAVYLNNSLEYHTEENRAELFIHTTLVQRDTIACVLLLGGGHTGLIQEIVKHGPDTIHYVEYNRILMELSGYDPSNPIYHLENGAVLMLHQDDPRNWLTEIEKEFDVIISGASDPMNAQTNRYYTEEFFHTCRTHLSDNGILVLRFNSSENYWTSQLLYRNQSIYSALYESFRNVLFLPGTENIAIASNGALFTEPEILSGRFRQRNIISDLVIPEYLEYIYSNDRFFSINRSMQGSAISPNSDLSPVSYHLSWMIWISMFFPRMAYMEPAVITRNITYVACIIGLLFIGIVLLLRIHKGLHRKRMFLVVFLTGFFGMTIETILLLVYQTNHGILYQDIGLLLTVYMAGLSAGAIFPFYTLRNKQEEHSLTSYSRKSTGLIHKYGHIGMVAISLLLYFLLTSNIQLSFIAVVLFLAGAGFLSSFLFAKISFLPEMREINYRLSLYAMDLLGGCIASLFVALFLVPVYGIAVTALIVTITSAFIPFLLHSKE